MPRTLTRLISAFTHNLLNSGNAAKIMMNVHEFDMMCKSNHRGGRESLTGSKVVLAQPFLVGIS